MTLKHDYMLDTTIPDTTTPLCTYESNRYEFEDGGNIYVICRSPREIDKDAFYGLRNGVLGYWRKL